MATNITPDNSTYEYNAPQFLNFTTPIMDYDGADKFFDAITDSVESNGVVPENLEIIAADSTTASIPSSPKPICIEDRNDFKNEHNVNNAESDVSLQSNFSNKCATPGRDLLNVISKTVKDAEESAKAKGIKRTYAPAIEYTDDVNGKDSYKIVAVEVGHRGVPVIKKGKNYTVVQPFSFEERHKRLQQEKEEKIQKILEEEKKMREFHANPPPSFIQPPSRTQTSTCTNPMPPKFRIEERIQERNKTKPKEDNSQHPFKAQPASVLQKAPFIPKKAECPLTDVTGFHLNTEERARKREEFNLIIKTKEAELESLKNQRKLEEEKKLAEEIRQLRKEVVHKANPVPVFKPMLHVTSSIPLTEPKSPNFASKYLIHKHKH